MDSTDSAGGEPALADEIADATTGDQGGRGQARSGPLVGAITRAIHVMDVLSGTPEGMELQALARAVGMSPSGVHRVLRTLLEGGLVQQAGTRGSYRLGLKVLTWAQNMHSEAALKAVADPELVALNASTRESVVLSLMRERRIWTVSRIEGQGGLVARPAHEEQRYFHTTARGYLFLAYMDPAEARALVASTGLVAMTARTITDERALWNIVDEVRTNGYAVNREGTVLGGGGLAVPVHDADGLMIACVALAVPMVRFDQEREEELLARTLETARRIESNWNPPSESVSSRQR